MGYLVSNPENAHFIKKKAVGDFMMATSIFCAHYDPDTGLHLYQLESLNSTALKKNKYRPLFGADHLNLV